MSLCRLFLQAGYLTIGPSPPESSFADLFVPNEEIKNYALPHLIVRGLLRTEDVSSHPHIMALSSAIDARDVETLYGILFALFQVIGYPDRGKIDKCEDYYQSILQALFLPVSGSVRVEERTSMGKCDLLAGFRDWKLLLELKVLHGKKDVSVSHERLKQTIEEAFDQVEKQYAKGLCPDVVCILVFNTATRTLYSRELLGDITFYKSTPS